MMEQVLAPENLRRAWQRVKSNAGAPGIDGMTVGEFPAFSREHWPRIRAALMAGTYRPAPVRRVFIPKPDGSQRPLGVPTVLDRVIQQALAQVMTPLFEGGFSDHSYGFRVGISHTYTALLELGEWVRRRARLYYWITLHYGPDARV
jgi:RNA-directed DNA polymerase